MRLVVPPFPPRSEDAVSELLLLLVANDAKRRKRNDDDFSILIDAPFCYEFVGGAALLCANVDGILNMDSNDRNIHNRTASR